jgi:hypothetical protein
MVEESLASRVFGSHLVRRASQLVVNNTRDLVDRTGKGRLSRTEFVLGMWLIDQSLGGRKLPLFSIPPDAWQSAQRLTTFSKQQ